MDSEFNWKKFQFITEVKTALINNAINLSLDDSAAENRHVFSTTGTLGKMDDAFYAADRIPNDMSAHQAACEFIGFICENLRSESMATPSWFTRR
ncbi:hypothetical protein [Amphritea pacifica]|uniref:hypothetical protein n=1 Tax=Amphritea pacifica TaxID=2811233 RepID=UPI0019643E01|nr:hypothetical protein [Amphritea pacifica]MBN1007794.1 hypothetical protein [Amphritea pacifica]